MCSQLYHCDGILNDNLCLFSYNSFQGGHVNSTRLYVPQEQRPYFILPHSYLSSEIHEMLFPPVIQQNADLLLSGFFED